MKKDYSTYLGPSRPVHPDVLKEFAMFLRTEFNYDRDKSSRETVIECDAESIDDNRTQQSFKEECDINEIVRRFGLTGKMPDAVGVPQEGDFTDVVDYQTAMNAVTKARENFMELPADIRYRFANDPQRLMEFCADGRNRDEAIKLGLVSKTPEVPRDAVKAIDELAAKLAVPKAAS